MKILVLTNYYPPFYLGGYELRCQAVVEEWKKKGHEVKILTTRFGLGDEININSTDVFRWLPSEPRPYRRWGIEGLWNAYRLKQRISSLLQKFSPDIVNVWNMGDFPKFVLCLVEAKSIPLAYHIEDASWLYRDFLYKSNARGWEYKNLASDPILRLWKNNSQHGAVRFIKNIFRVFFRLNIQIPPLFCIRHATFVSQFRMQEYFKLGDNRIHAEVVYGGIDVQRFSGLVRNALKTPIKLLYVGQIYREKGLHTILEALSLLDGAYQSKFDLNIAGGVHAEEQAYFEELKQFVSKRKLPVHFLGKIKYENLPAIYRGHDVLIFPSIIPEGFALTPLEGMASGMIVFSTATGGNAELVRNGINSSIFREDDPQDLAKLLIDLASNPQKYEKLAIQGKSDAFQNFSVETMAEKIILFLQKVITT